MSRPLVPPPEILQTWNDLDAVPIIGTVPRSVPLATFVRPQTDDTFHSRVALTSQVSSAEIVLLTTQISEASEKIQRSINEIYPMRSCMQILYDTLNSIRAKGSSSTDPNDPFILKQREIATTVHHNLSGTLRKIQSNLTGAISCIENIFHDYPLWDTGRYNAAFLDAICLLIFRFVTLATLCPTKAAISDDFGILALMGVSHSEDDIDLRAWIMMPNRARMDLLGKLHHIDYQHTAVIFKIFWHRVSEAIDKQLFVYPEAETAFIVAQILFIDWYSRKASAEVLEAPLQSKRKFLKPIYDIKGIRQMVKLWREKYPALILCFEYSVDFDQCCTTQPLETQFGPKQPANLPFSDISGDLRSRLDKLSSLYSKLNAATTPSQRHISALMTNLPDTLRALGSAIYTVRRLIIDRTLHPPPNPDAGEGSPILSAYERAMRFGLNDDERQHIMEVLVTVRSTRELISSNLMLSHKLITGHIQTHLQDFVRNKLEAAVARSAKVRDLIQPDIDKLRILLGSFSADSDVGIRTSRSKDLTPFTDQHVSAPPHLALIDLLRAQIQAFINPQSPCNPKKVFVKKLETQNVTDFTNFLETSKFWSYLLRLDDTLSVVCDQSALFFKEYFLYSGRGQSKKIQYFPVTTSLPYVLVDFTIKHAHQQEMSGSLFFPLTIYDDAASFALRELKSRYLYHEIRAESHLCLTTIARMLSEYVFRDVYDFAVQRFADQSTPSLISKPNPAHYQSNAALRITAVLQQNQLFLLGHQYDVKRHFAGRLNQLFKDQVESNFHIVRKHGLQGILVFKYMVELLRDMHEAFQTYGLCLLPLDLLINSVLTIDNPMSLESEVLSCCINHLQRTLIRKCILQMNPLRLIPQDAILQSVDTFFKGKRYPIPAVLKGTATFVCVDHFTGLISLAGDVAAHRLAEELGKIVQERLPAFMAHYQKMKESIKRISDPPISTGTHKFCEPFEGAYRQFVFNPDVDHTFVSMKQFGNVLAIAQMTDMAFLLHQSPRQQIMAYLCELNTQNTDTRSDAIFRIFDAEFQKRVEFFKMSKIAPSPDEISLPIFQSMVTKFTRTLREGIRMLTETSDKLLNFPTLTGFAAVWSVLEYVYCLREVFSCDPKLIRDKTAPEGAFSLYGEGVFLCAALIIVVAKQESLAKLLKIGRRILQHKRTDIVTAEEVSISHFLTADALAQAALDYSLGSVRPAVRNVPDYSH
jgi:hypothetical protein